jgi:hypothetical protein
VPQPPAVASQSPRKQPLSEVAAQSLPQQQLVNGSKPAVAPVPVKPTVVVPAPAVKQALRKEVISVAAMSPRRLQPELLMSPVQAHRSAPMPRENGVPA